MWAGSGGWKAVNSSSRSPQRNSFPPYKMSRSHLSRGVNFLLIGVTLNNIRIFQRPKEALFPQTCGETVGPNIFNGEIDYHRKKHKRWNQVVSSKQFCPSTISAPSQGEQDVLLFQENKMLDSDNNCGIDGRYWVSISTIWNDQH